MPATEVGFDGMTVVLGTSGWTADITGASWSGIHREAIPTWHAGTTLGVPAASFGGKTFIPSKLVDPGEITLEVAHNPGEDMPIADVAETLTFTWAIGIGDTSAAIFACEVFCTDYEFTGTTDDKWTASVTFKCSGVATETPST